MGPEVDTIVDGTLVASPMQPQVADVEDARAAFDTKLANFIALIYNYDAVKLIGVAVDPSPGLPNGIGAGPRRNAYARYAGGLEGDRATDPVGGARRSRLHSAHPVLGIEYERHLMATTSVPYSSVLGLMVGPGINYIAGTAVAALCTSAYTPSQTGHSTSRTSRPPR